MKILYLNKSFLTIKNIIIVHDQLCLVLFLFMIKNILNYYYNFSIIIYNIILIHIMYINYKGIFNNNP